MNAEIAMRRRGATLVPVDQVSDDELRNAAREGQDVLVTVKAPRNVRQHRLMMALMQKLVDAGVYQDRAEALYFMKMESRHVTFRSDPRSGNVFMEPKSVAFASCSQQQFNLLFNRMIWIVCDRIIPGLPEGDLRHEIEALVDGDRNQKVAA